MDSVRPALQVTNGVFPGGRSYFVEKIDSSHPFLLRIMTEIRIIRTGLSVRIASGFSVLNFYSKSRL
jgi:hypothetical protein